MMRRFVEGIKQIINSKVRRRKFVYLFRHYLLFLLVVLCLLGAYLLRTRSTRYGRAAFDDVNFVRSAYRVDDSTIRIVFVRSMNNFHNLTYEYGKKKGRIRLECHNEHCPDPFSPPCRLNGYVGIINDLTKQDYQSYLVIFSDLNMEDPLFINVQNARNVDLPKHKLGVCVQPIYLHTDFSALVQFFEFWLSENATKFYVYRESYTKEVGELLQFYASQKGIQVDFIDWSSLPLIEEDSSDSRNPNRYWFRLEVFMAIFDCVHRARGNVKYLAQTDLDEIIYVGKDRSIIKFMDIMDKQEPMMASVSFRSQRVQVMNSTWAVAQNPSELSFTNLDEIILEDRVFKRPLYAKMIYRPERVFHVHIHRQLQTERIPGTDTFYKHVNIAPEGGVVLHIRRLKDMYPWTNAYNSSILMDTAERMEKNFQERISNYTFGISEWTNYGFTINEHIEKCRQSMNRNRDHACHNIWDCDKTVTSIDWVRVPNCWLTV
ncbi:unnamed protein product [Bursaphelenchus xylophilus]|uniref:Glycosyltransferase family 92 protein n=1 Tax=Bursaphelenchus xylophilus TaxID=6326 RepID=A0A1I7S2X5_BURXY|nr:unnamed protein product [Bursaphelenchus xylophilus]CAG9116018.1 unnamed protein product [Bursaphelenchus xylophilus]